MMIMDNRAQVSVEYLTMLAIGLLLAGVVLLLIVNIFSLKEGIVQSIHALRDRIIQV
jgi:uncharacterized protein (UPF0333 family)